MRACLKGTVVSLTIIALAAVSVHRATADSNVTLKKGDRIIFLGDSITAAGAAPAGYVSLVRNAMVKKHRDLKLEVLGAGVSGNKVPDLQKRVDKDVIAKKPTIVVIYIGINDVWHGERDPAKGTPKDKFEAGLKEVIEKITTAGAQVVLCTPSVIGEKKDGANKLDARLDEYAEVIRQLAKEMNLPLCDLRRTFVDNLKTKNLRNFQQGVYTTDGVHLNVAGNQVVAEAILRTLGN